MHSGRRITITMGLATVIVVVICFSSLSFIDDWRQRQRGFEIIIRFSNLNNLSQGAPVKLAGGPEVGVVKAIFQKNMQTYVRVYLDNILLNKIPRGKDSQFSIFTTSLFGQKYVNLFLRYSESELDFLKPGDETTGISPPSVDQFLLAFSSWFDGKSSEQVFQGIASKVEIFLKQLNEVVNENRADVNETLLQASRVYTRFSRETEKLSRQMKVIAGNMNVSTAGNKQRLKKIASDLAGFNSSLDKLSKSLKSGSGSLSKLVNSKELRKNFRLTYYHGTRLVDCLNNRAFDVVFNKKSCD